MLTHWRIKVQLKHGDKYWLTRLLWKLEKLSRGIS